MSTGGTLRRWPSRNFLAELEPDPSGARAMDDFVDRHPRLRRLKNAMRTASRSIRPHVGPGAWTRFDDARATLQTAVLEEAFNVGFENGLIAGRTESRRGGRQGATEPDERFQAEILRLLVRADLPAGRLLGILLRFCQSLAAGEPPITGGSPDPSNP